MTRPLMMKHEKTVMKISVTDDAYEYDWVY